jgi:hypothetical protein
MKDVRTILAHAFNALMDISKDHDLKADKLDENELNALLSDLAKLSELTEEAKRRAAGYIEITLYAIGKETAPGEYSGFTHGPNPSQEALLEYVATDGLEDGDALVKSVQVGGVINHVTLAIWLDDKWNETGDEPKEATA